MEKTQEIGNKIESLTRDNMGEVLDTAGMNWDVDQLPLYLAERVDVWDGNGVTTTYTGGNQRLPTHVANVRSDNGEVLAVVGKGYEVFQNSELAELVMAVEGKSGATIAQAGVLTGGADVFFLLNNGTFELPGDDVVDTYHFFGNNHTGKRGINTIPTSQRVHCANILNAIVAGSDVRGLRIWHTKNLRDRLIYALEAIHVSEHAAKEFQSRCEHLASIQMGSADVKSYFASVYDDSYGPMPTLSELDRVGAKQKLTRRRDALEAWAANLQKETERMGNLPLTAWNALNAVTEWADHTRRAREGGRVHANILGASASFKEKAFKLAGAV